MGIMYLFRQNGGANYTYTMAACQEGENMKIRLTMPGAAIAVEVAEHQAKNMFKELAAQLLGMEPVKVVKRQMPVKVAGGTVGTATEAVVNPEERKPGYTNPEDSPPVTERPGDEPVPVSSAVHNATQGFKGFLYIRCENCGKEGGSVQRNRLNPTAVPVVTKRS